MSSHVSCVCVCMCMSMLYNSYYTQSYDRMHEYCSSDMRTFLKCVRTYRDVPMTYRPPRRFTISFSLLTVLSNSPVAAANAARSSLPFNNRGYSYRYCYCYCYFYLYLYFFYRYCHYYYHYHYYYYNSYY